MEILYVFNPGPFSSNRYVRKNRSVLKHLKTRPWLLWFNRPTLPTHLPWLNLSEICRVLKGPGVEPRGGGGTLGNPKDSVWEDWGTLGKIRGITNPA